MVVSRTRLRPGDAEEKEFTMSCVKDPVKVLKEKMRYLCRCMQAKGMHYEARGLQLGDERALEDFASADFLHKKQAGWSNHSPLGCLDILDIQTFKFEVLLRYLAALFNMVSISSIIEVVYFLRTVACYPCFCLQYKERRFA